MKKYSKHITATWAIMSLLLAWALPAAAQQDSGRRVVSQSLTVPLYKSRVVGLNAPAARVSVGNPDVADILITIIRTA